MNNVARQLLPLFFGLTSLTAVACAAPATTDADTGEAEANAPAADTQKPPASDLSGSIGSSREHGLPSSSATNETLSAGVELFVPATGVVFEVLAYEFGIENTPNLGSASGGAGAGKAALKPLKVSVRAAKPGTAPLMQHLTAGIEIDTLVLRQQGSSKGAGTEIAKFESTFVTSMSTGIENGTIDTYEIAIAKVAVPFNTSKGSAKTISHDVVTDQYEGAELCEGKLGPFVQADAAWPIAKDAVRIDSAEVKVDNQFTFGGAAGGAGAGKATLERFAIEGSLANAGACALLHTAAGALLPSVRVDAAAMDLTTNKVTIPQTWEACQAAVRTVVFSGGANQAPRQTVTLDATGVVRTDRAKGAANHVSGWSFKTNTAIAACPTP